MTIEKTYVLVLLFLTLCQVEGQEVSPRFDFSYSADFLGLFEGENVPLTVSINAIDSGVTSGTLRLKSLDQSIFTVNNLTTIDVASLGQIPANFTTVIEGLFVGISDLEIYFTEGEAEDGDLIESYVVKVKHVDSILNPLFSYMVLAWLIISYIMMGSKMEFKGIWEIIKKPWVLLLAMACQFFLMPALAFALAKAFRLDDTTSLGLIMVGTCPGGWLSNIFSLLLDCDFVLSLTMTFFSTIFAMGMMPFNLWLYARPLTTGAEDLQTPFLDLFLQILYLVIPIGISMVIARYSSKFRKYCEKLLKPVATICILVAVGLGVPAQLHIYKSASGEEYAVSILLPFMGCIAGLIIAKICCLEKRKAITVSLETGAQNSLLAATMLELFYPAPESDLIGKVPYIMALFSLVEGIIVTVIYLLAKYVFCKARFASDDSDEDENEKEKEMNANDYELQDKRCADTPVKTPSVEMEKSPNDHCLPVPALSSIGIQVDMTENDGTEVGADNRGFTE
ncbi:hepatic sodium/bile acid cotransporter-like [Diadema antillarum]|uniref:hepatic sodium/bile acid cotransporter-like n=1 Tax=Diadema antillarum TaxID=105358 RepID=UPI003A856066